MATEEFTATISLRPEQRESLRRLREMLKPRVGRITYGEAIEEAERIVRERLNEELAKTGAA